MRTVDTVFKSGAIGSDFKPHMKKQSYCKPDLRFRVNKE